MPVITRNHIDYTKYAEGLVWGVELQMRMHHFFSFLYVLNLLFSEKLNHICLTDPTINSTTWVYRPLPYFSTSCDCWLKSYSQDSSLSITAIEVWRRQLWGKKRRKKETLWCQNKGIMVSSHGGWSNKLRACILNDKYKEDRIIKQWTRFCILKVWPQ